MEKTTVLLADDHRIVLEGLKGLLADDYDVVGTVEDGRALLEHAQRLHPDVIVVDIAMPLLNGIDAVKQIKKLGLNAKVVFLTMHHDAMYAKEAIEAGALGFVLKHSAPSELTMAIQEALKGNTYISPAIAQDVMQLYRDNVDAKTGASGSLTLRQREVMQLLAEGKSAKEIAHILHISTRTVEFHKYNMMEQLGIKTSAELVHFAIKHGIVSI
jgi:DNA-binding NarL/FixJ family response regulator